MDLQEHLRFSRRKTPAFGERDFWECKICRSKGGDEPALGRTALETAQQHFDNAALHFQAVAFMPPPGGTRDALLNWMIEELTVYGRLSPKDAAVLCSQMARDFYASELREKNETIERLTQEVSGLKRSANGEDDSQDQKLRS